MSAIIIGLAPLFLNVNMAGWVRIESIGRFDYNICVLYCTHTLLRINLKAELFAELFAHLVIVYGSLNVVSRK